MIFYPDKSKKNHPNHLALDEAIANCYKVFEPYQHLPLGESSPISVTDKMRLPLETKHLYLLTEKELNSFVFKTLTTWGTEDDLRHFLPRILELKAGEAFLVWPYDVFFKKLAYGNWRSWPQAEQDAVESYCKALWHYILNLVEIDKTQLYNSFPGILLEDMSEIVDVLPYLQAWGKSQNAILQLAVLLLNYAQAYKQNGIIYHVEWWKKPKRLTPVQEWLISQEHLLSFEEAFFDYPNSSILSMAIDVLYWTLKQKGLVK